VLRTSIEALARAIQPS